MDTHKPTKKKTETVNVNGHLAIQVTTTKQVQRPSKQELFLVP
jgi:hypothetical protein